VPQHWPFIFSGFVYLPFNAWGHMKYLFFRKNWKYCRISYVGYCMLLTLHKNSRNERMTDLGSVHRHTRMRTQTECCNFGKYVTNPAMLNLCKYLFSNYYNLKFNVLRMFIRHVCLVMMLMALYAVS